VRWPAGSGTEQVPYAPGARLPSERELAEEHEVDRSTVRRALRILAEGGRITPASERKYEVHVRASRERPIPVLRDIDTGPGRCTREWKNPASASTVRSQ